MTGMLLASRRMAYDQNYSKTMSESLRIRGASLREQILVLILHSAELFITTCGKFAFR